MGSLEISAKAFTREKEYLLSNECSGHRRGEGPETDPLLLGLCRAMGPGRTQSKGMLVASCPGSNANSTVSSCVMVANCSTFLYLSFLIYKMGMQ